MFFCYRFNCVTVGQASEILVFLTFLNKKMPTYLLDVILSARTVRTINQFRLMSCPWWTKSITILEGRPLL